MAWIHVKPANLGGGRKPDKPTAKVYEGGQMTISHATCDMLGTPARVRVQVEPDLQRIRLQPSTPSDTGAFSLAGGGNSPHRISLRAVLRLHPQLAGEYIAVKMTGGVELHKEN